MVSNAAELHLWNSLKGELVNSSDLHLFQAMLQCAHSCAKEWTATVSEGLALVEEGHSLLPRLCNAVRSQLLQGLDNS